MTRHSRIVHAFIVALTACATATACGGASTPNSANARGAGDSTKAIARGGEITIAVRTEPATFNRLRKRDTSTELVSTLTEAKLVRINRATQEVEPALAESWTRSDDGRRYVVKLRPNVTFSDGHPFTSADVVFTFDALYDEKTGSELIDGLELNGKKLDVVAVDPLTVAITFPAAFAPGVRILDNLPIVPKHKLEAAFKAGTFGSAWNLTTPPSEIVGLGPFVMSQYVPGQRLVFDRNPRYYRKDANGAPLPYLDRITIDIAPDQDTQMLRLDAGQADLIDDAMRPEDYAPLKRAADAGRVQLLDLGVSYEAPSLWFNLKPGAFGTDPRAAWLQRDELRLAISYAVDRRAFADTVYLGAGVPVFGPVTPANKKWFSADTPETPYDPARAKALLASIGLTDRNGDGLLEDAQNRPARFTLVTQKGRAALERAASVIRDDLKKVGIIVDVVTLDGKSLIERFLSMSGFDAVYFTITTTDTDPAINPDFWFSSGSGHVWNMGQATPATAWERAIDELMTKQVASSDDHERQRLFNEVQKIFAEHLPMIYFAAPRIYVAAATRVTNLTPSLIRPQLLWSPDTLAVKPTR